MASNLISREATLERMKSMAGCATCDNYNYVRCRACSWDDAMNIVEEMSEVDAAPVVRCKDCRYSHLTYSGEVKYCDRISMPDDEGDYGYALYLPGDFYCACGEQKDGGEA